MDKIYRVRDIIGGRYVLIECRDMGKVVDFYTSNGLTLLQVDKSDEYLQIIRRL